MQNPERRIENYKAVVFGQAVMWAVQILTAYQQIIFKIHKSVKLGICLKIFNLR
jgi:hypothetical protein